MGCVVVVVVVQVEYMTEQLVTEIRGTLYEYCHWLDRDCTVLVYCNVKYTCVCTRSGRADSEEERAARNSDAVEPNLDLMDAHFVRREADHEVAPVGRRDVALLEVAGGRAHPRRQLERLLLRCGQRDVHLTQSAHLRHGGRLALARHQLQEALAAAHHRVAALRIRLRDALEHVDCERRARHVAVRVLDVHVVCARLERHVRHVVRAVRVVAAVEFGLRRAFDAQRQRPVARVRRVDREPVRLVREARLEALAEALDLRVDSGVLCST